MIGVGHLSLLLRGSKSLDSNMFDWAVRILANIPGISGYSLYGNIRHPVDSLLLSPYREVKYFIQRGYRGYSDRDRWGLSYYLATWLPKALREIKNKHTGVSIGFASDVTGPSFDWTSVTDEDWERIRESFRASLEAMAVGFEAHNTLENDLPMPGSDRAKELEALRNQGLALFARYFDSLLD